MIGNCSGTLFTETIYQDIPLAGELLMKKEFENNKKNALGNNPDLRDDIDDEEEPTNPSQKEFYRISKIVFQDLEKKYRIHLDNYELSILYELLSKVIKEPIGLDEA